MSAISHGFIESPNWTELRKTSPTEAATSLRGLLRDCEAFEKQVFALRGMCALLIEERELWTEFIDPEVDQPYASFDRFIKTQFPNSWGYIRDALRAVKELKDMPFEDLLQIKRANLEQLKKVSSNVRILPDVIQAAKTLPEKEFVAKMNKEQNQHLDIRQPVVMADKGDVDEFEAAVEMAITIEECKTRAEAIKAIGVFYVVENAVEYEHKKGASAA